MAVAVTGFAFAASTVVVDGSTGSHISSVYLFSDAIGASFLTAGIVAWWQRPENPMGRVMAAGGALWFASNLQASTNPVIVAVGFWLTYLPAVLGGHLVLAYPGGRLSHPVERYGVLASYVSYLALQGTRYLVEGPGPRLGSPVDTPNSPWANVVAMNGLAFTVMLVVLIVVRWAAASGPARRLHAPVWFLGCVMSALVTACTVVTALAVSTTAHLALILAYGLCLVALPFVSLSGLLRMRLARHRVADLVLALEHDGDPTRLRDLLARTLGDPSLVLGFWSPSSGCHVDVDGRPVAVPGNSAARSVTAVERDGHRLAVLVHDSALNRQPLVHAAVAAARLALDNARLQAVLRAQLAQLHASRARLAEAALVERRKIERDLHDGLQHRLLRLCWLAERAGLLTDAQPERVRPAVEDLAAEAREAHVTLRELARGIHPAVLTERGIAAAVEEQALRHPVPLAVDLPAGRWPAAVEATAYFVILEAVTNAAKHAQADEITVRGWHRAGVLTVEIADDGRGGADPRGSGLLGLRDRVAALGGTLTVHSVPGEGTRVIVDLPCG